MYVLDIYSPETGTPAVSSRQPDCCPATEQLSAVEFPAWSVFTGHTSMVRNTGYSLSGLFHSKASEETHFVALGLRLGHDILRKRAGRSGPD